MKKLVYMLMGICMLSCDADRTELPRFVDQEVPNGKISVSLYERVVLEVTLLRPISGSPDSTYVVVKNKSGRALEKVGFYLESCPKPESDVQDCAPDYYYAFTRAVSLKDGEEVVEKIRKFVDFEYSNKIYVTTFKSDTTAAPPLANRYLYAQITKKVEKTTDTTSYTGSGKVFVQTDGTFFCRGNIFGEKDTPPQKLRLGGTISQSYQVYAKDLTQSAESLPFLFLGNVNSKTVSAKATITKDHNEYVDILLK